ncbi:MAG: hypothetical protein ACOCXZ_03400 [Chloroflexota bacterium]
MIMILPLQILRGRMCSACARIVVAFLKTRNLPEEGGALQRGDLQRPAALSDALAGALSPRAKVEVRVILSDEAMLKLAL